MKKLNLNVVDFGATEILSREELKKVLGGTGTGSESGSTSCSAECSDGTKISFDNCNGACFRDDGSIITCKEATFILTKECPA